MHGLPLLVPCCYTWPVIHGISSVDPTMGELCTHADFCSRPTLNINIDFIRLFDCNNNASKCLETGEQALSRPPGESTRGKGRKED